MFRGLLFRTPRCLNVSGKVEQMADKAKHAAAAAGSKVKEATKSASKDDSASQKPPPMGEGARRAEKSEQQAHVDAPGAFSKTSAGTETAKKTLPGDQAPAGVQAPATPPKEQNQKGQPTDETKKRSL